MTLKNKICSSCQKDYENDINNQGVIYKMDWYCDNCIICPICCKRTKNGNCKCSEYHSELKSLNISSIYSIYCDISYFHQGIYRYTTKKVYSSDDINFLLELCNKFSTENTETLRYIQEPNIDGDLYNNFYFRNYKIDFSNKRLGPIIYSTICYKCQNVIKFDYLDESLSNPINSGLITSNDNIDLIGDIYYNNDIVGTYFKNWYCSDCMKCKCGAICIDDLRYNCHCGVNCNECCNK